MFHDFDLGRISVIISANNSLPDTTRRDIGQQLSHRPHADRRAFMLRLHELYSETRCVSKIREKLLSNQYYSFIEQQGCDLITICLQHNKQRNQYQYTLLCNVGTSS